MSPGAMGNSFTSARRKISNRWSKPPTRSARAVYDINYVRAADIKALVTPLLTPAIGTISETTPAEQGIAPDNTKAGGDQFAGGETILVRDFMTVLDEIDQVISEVDHRPARRLAHAWC